jgi:energy-coupling factor transporter ATP-binding protein EcfA2
MNRAEQTNMRRGRRTRHGPHVDDTFTGVKGTEWTDRPAYRIPLRNYRVLQPPINRSEFLESPAYRDRVSNLLTGQHGLFFNRDFKLNQGSYLTAAPVELVKLWDEIYRRKTGKTLLPGIDLPDSEPPLESLDSGDRLSQKTVVALSDALRGAGLKVTDAKIIQFLSSLASKRFLLVTGLSGSGKSRLAQAVARCLVPARKPNPFYSMVPVGADWTGNENVLGYADGLDKDRYVTKPALDLILHATAYPDIPHFLILDEMNLSHVERYFADILSAIESEEAVPLHQDRERKAGNKSVPAEIALPRNLFVIGTVNVDETTYMFSPKVLDRANVIEFRMSAEELASFLSNPTKPDLAKLDGKGAAFGKAFVEATTNPVDVPTDAKEAYEAEVLLFFRALQPHGAEFGYRVAHEAARFVHYYKLLGHYPDGDTSWFPEAFDCVVFQKVLPKLHGSRSKLGPVLKKLWFLCVNNVAGRGMDALTAAEEAARSTDKKAEPSIQIPPDAPYPLSAEKIARMWRLLNDNGFASFAEA